MPNIIIKRKSPEVLNQTQIDEQSITGLTTADLMKKWVKPAPVGSGMTHPTRKHAASAVSVGIQVFVQKKDEFSGDITETVVTPTGFNGPISTFVDLRRESRGNSGMGCEASLAFLKMATDKPEECVDGTLSAKFDVRFRLTQGGQTLVSQLPRFQQEEGTVSGSEMASAGSEGASDMTASVDPFAQAETELAEAQSHSDFYFDYYIMSKGKPQRVSSLKLPASLANVLIQMDKDGKTNDIQPVLRPSNRLYHWCQAQVALRKDEATQQLAAELADSEELLGSEEQVA